MRQLYNLIQDFRNGDADTFTLILERFEPKLNKLQRESVYEDMKSDLILFMFKLLNKIPLEKEVFREDKYIISYINKSLQHQYIYLNKYNYKVKSSERVLEETYINNGDDNCFSNIIFEDCIKNLTEIEKDTIFKRYQLNYSEAEIGRMKGISRQAVHKTHVRALSKMKKLLS
ncbi:MAG: RNA polymerase sigma factor [Paraclostridium sp.]